MTARIGIDIGSTTVKVILLDADGRISFSAYRRHKAETLVTLKGILSEALAQIGDTSAKVLMTGSAGLGVSEKYDLPFIQEVVASAEVVKQWYPQVKTLIDIGGEDAKMIFFSPDGVPDIRMNGSCAGGTGAFIDEMASLLDVDITEIEQIANQTEVVHPIASRCGVFAKTDVQNLLSREVPREEIVSSILNAVVLQTLATLARGYDVSSQILFCGGPLTFIPSLRKAFMHVLELSPDDVHPAPDTQYLPAIGAALAANGEHAVYSLQGLIDLLNQPQAANSNGYHRLEPLFADQSTYQRWRATRSQGRIEEVPLSELAGKDCFLGVDSGSTTSKVVLIDQQGRVAYKYYSSNKGNAIKAIQLGLDELRQAIAILPAPPRIRRSVVTGYGEDLIRAAFGFDQGMVETLAHYRAAKAFDERVTFILDIGGQDMKAIFIQDGHIQNIEINEACSSGCGSFIESFAKSMGYRVEDFADIACNSSAPCDLGSRCTVFMNSRVKQALREAAEVKDISSGLAYAVIKNAIQKVLKISDTSVLGDHIIVQGGTFRNPAVHKAMEQLVGRPVICPDLAELMGAYGAALFARDTSRSNWHHPSRFIGLEHLENASNYQKRSIRCRGCENQCAVTKLIFPNGNVFYTGNRCERTFTNRGEQVTKGTNLHEDKLKLLFDRQVEPADIPRATIGIPRVLNMYENYPFWNTLLIECGFKVQLSDPSSNAIFEKGAGTVMSENICFPAKLTHGHIYDLIEKGVDRIFFPMVFYETQEFCDAANCFNCPIVSGYPDVVRSAIDPEKQFGIPLDKPTINFQNEKLLKKACLGYLSELGVPKRTASHALAKAIEAQQIYKQEVSSMGVQIMQKAWAEGRKVILLLGRPYHLDPLINHGIPKILTDFGVDVVTEDALPLYQDRNLDNKHILTQWAYLNRYYYATSWAGEQDNLEVVQLNSFACGPDAYTMDEVKNILSSYGKGHTVIRIDEIESTGSTKLRLRSLIEATRLNPTTNRERKPRKRVKLYEASDRKKKVLTPYFSRFTAPTIAGPLIAMDYDVETLPPPDRESVEVGLKYTQNEICYPGIIVIGDMIKALKSGKYDLNNVAVGSWQTGGQCRASSILSLLKRALIAAGFEDIPIVALTTSKYLHEQPGYDLNVREYIYKAVMASVYTDSISNLYHATAVREINPGEALALADRLLEPLRNGTMRLERAVILKKLREAVASFNAIATKDRHLPKVGIVGEIYVKFNSFVNNHVAEWLMDQKIEVVVPPLLEFFLGWFVMVNTKVRENLDNRNLLWLLANALDKYLHRFLDQADVVMQEFKYYHPSHTIHDIADKAKDIVSLTHQYGEGWLIAGEIGEFVNHGINNVLCLQPFGCIANQVVAKGVAKRMKEKYQQLNLIFLDLDAGISEVNFFNRMYFFINRAREGM